MYTLSIHIDLAGASDEVLLAQIRDTAGQPIGIAIADGFVDLGEGHYLWTYEEFPDAYRGVVTFTTEEGLVAAVAINPQEHENADALITSRLAQSGYTAPSNADIAAIRAKVDAFLDATISSRLDQDSYSPPDNDDIDAILEIVGINIDAPISSLLRAQDYTAPNNAAIAQINAKADAILNQPAGPSLDAIAARLTLDHGAGPWVTTTPAVIESPPPYGTALTIRRHSGNQIGITGLGSLAGRDRLWFTVKRNAAAPDTSAILMIEESAGLIVINGTIPAPGTATITINNAATGDITITIPAATARNIPPGDYDHDIKIRNTGQEPRVIASGSVLVKSGITHAIE